MKLREPKVELVANNKPNKSWWIDGKYIHLRVWGHPFKHHVLKIKSSCSKFNMNGDYEW